MTKEKSPINEPNNETKCLLSSGEASVPSMNPPTDEDNSIEMDSLEASINDDSPAPLSLMEETSIGATTWNSNKKVTGLWSSDHDKNVFAHIAGTGWKKLARHSESGIVALNMLASHARAENSKVNYRDEKDGMIYEIYVW